MEGKFTLSSEYEPAGDQPKAIKEIVAALKRKERQPQWSGREIRYRMTVNGVEPEPFVESGLDYQHYLDRQLAPIADGILHFLGMDFAALVDEQMTLF
jgi:DNA polymerase-2